MVRSARNRSTVTTDAKIVIYTRIKPQTVEALDQIRESMPYTPTRDLSHRRRISRIRRTAWQTEGGDFRAFKTRRHGKSGKEIPSAAILV